MRIPVILGPTGVGKSNFAIQLAKKINGEIISADSCQVYKGFDIGTAKITKSEMEGIEHHLIDILEPYEKFNACIFKKLANDKINEILKNNKIPIICGGTGLYIKGLLYDYDFNQLSADVEFRKQCEEICTTSGIEVLYKKLLNSNPELASEIKSNDKTRIIRALETNSKPNRQKIDERFVVFAISEEREKLYEKINDRVDKMVLDGLFEEAQKLYGQYGQNIQGFSSIGYKEILDYFNNKQTREKTIELIKQHSRNYAKRQFTFIRGIENVIWVKKNTLDEVIDNYEKFI